MGSLKSLEASWAYEEEDRLQAKKNKARDDKARQAWEDERPKREREERERKREDALVEKDAIKKSEQYDKENPEFQSLYDECKKLEGKLNERMAEFKVKLLKFQSACPHILTHSERGYYTTTLICDKCGKPLETYSR